MISSTQEPCSLDLWLGMATELQLPMLDHSILQLRRLSENVNEPPSKLAGIILQDPLLTARVLRMANSVYYNPSRGHIRTVSRAVIVLGFGTVRSICLSSMVLENFCKASNNQPLIEELAWSFVSAIMLKALALQKSYKEVEELYIGSLLYRMGYLMFWLSERPECARVAEALANRQSRSMEAVERSVLGFSLNDLGLKLLRGWSVSGLLNELFVRGPQAVEGGSLLVSLHQYINALRFQPNAEASCQALAKLLNQSPKQVDLLLKQGIQRTQSALKDYGAPEVVSYLERWSMRRWQESSCPDEPTSNKEPLAATGFSQQQQQIQLAVIKDLLTQLTVSPDASSLMQLLLEGLQQGAGFNRVLVSFLDPSRNRLSAKFVLAKDSDPLQSQFSFSRMGVGRDLIDWLCLNREVHYGCQGQTPVFSDLVQRLACREYMLAPLWGSSKAIGALYVDNAGAAIGAHQQDAFRLFSMQASMVILWLEQRRSV